MDPNVFTLGPDDLTHLVREGLIGDIIRAIDLTETNGTIAQNMIGAVDWSLVSWLRQGFFTNENKGRVYVSFNHLTLTSISCSYINETRVLGLDKEEYRVGCRMWIHPRARHQLYPTFKHILPAMIEAKKLEMPVVWTSFNEDRAGLGRKIDRLKGSVDAIVRSTWEDWIIKYDPVEVNNTMQSIAYCKL